MAPSLSCFAPRKAFAARKQPHAACLTSRQSEDQLSWRRSKLGSCLLTTWQATWQGCLPWDPDNSNCLLCRRRSRLQSCLLTR